MTISERVVRVREDVELKFAAARLSARHVYED
jgi:hypothetical protein